MKLRLKGCLAVAAVTLSMVTSAQAQYSKVVVFSDSMSDTHRYYDLTKALFGEGLPAAPPNYPGRFCDGPVAVEVLADKLGAPILNYSFSGATSGYLTLLGGFPWGVLTQVNEHLNNNALVPTISTVPVLSGIINRLPGTGKADPKALYFIWTGPDDYYFPGGMNSLTAYTATANIQQAIASLYAAGARYFFVPTMPDLSITPRAGQREQDTPGYKANAAKYSAQFSTVLTRALADAAKRYPQAKIMTFDTLSFLKVEMAKAVAEGKNVTEACYPITLNLTQFTRPPVCKDPENHMFWDDNHPTQVANRVLGQAWSKAIVYHP